MNRSSRECPQSLIGLDEFHRKIMDSLPFAVILSAPNGDNLYVNPQACAMTGYSREELIQSVWMVHPDDTEAPAILEKALRDGTTGQDYETRYVRKDGSVFWASVAWRPIKTPDGKIEALCTTITDISARKTAEEALQSVDHHYSLLADNASDIIWEMDVDGRFTYVSQAVGRLGYSPQDWIGHNVAEFMPPEEHPAFEQRKNDDSRNPQPGLYEVRALRKDGSQVWMELSVDFVIEDGVPVKIFGAARDVSSRKRAEDDLLRTTHEIEAILGAFPDLYFRLDKSGRILDYKSGCPEELYVPPESFIGKPMQDVIPKRVGEQFIKALTEVNKMHSQVSVEYSLPMPAGIQYYEARCVPFLGDQVLAIIRNITERHKAEEALKENEQKYKSIVENSSDIIMLMNSDSKIIYISPAVRDVLGYEPDELVGTQPMIVHPEDLDIVRKRHSESLQGISGTNFEYRMITKNGDIKWVSHSWSPIFSGHELQMTVSVVRDVTESKQSEQALRKAHADLERAYRMQKEFLNNVTHEVRTPLTAVKGYAEMLLEGVVGPLSDDQAALLRKVLVSSEHLLEVVTGVLEIARLKSGRIAPNTRICNPRHIVDKAISAIIPQAQSKGLHINPVTDCKGCLGAYDEDKVTTILTNLLGNAVKFTEQGEISVLLYCHKPGFEVVVADTGIGIRPSDLSSIFDEFKQLDYPGKHKPKGFGIGLAIVATMVETIGGSLCVSSRKGVGTAFTLYVPQLNS